jgi:two-component system CheB/CheR fusion protein
MIVAVGAPASRLDAVEQLAASLQLSPDEAIVFVFQHREALDEHRFLSALGMPNGRVTSKVEDGAPVQGGHLYICAPNVITTVEDARFQVREAQQRPGERGTIDSLFVSLAEDRSEEAIGVVLYGTGGDGTLGISAMKDHGGLGLAERGPEEHEAHLAESQTAAALADFILPVAEIPAHVAAYVRHFREREARREFEEMLDRASTSLGRIADILRTKTGNDFHGYKRNTFLRRVQRRMQVVQIDDVERYVEHLRSDGSEVQSLFNDLLIGVTQFFRDGREFEILQEQVVPKLFDGKGTGGHVRVWVLGCATGEEAYSIGILLREHVAKLEAHPHIQIFATDIDGRALAAARVGRYRETIENDVSPERLARWFVKEGNTYCVVKELREMCIFSQHNVIKDAPFSKLDLISCRNLLIYLNADLQNRVIPLFHFALLPDRYLFLGNSENVTRHPKLFVPIDRRARIFKRLDTGARLPPDFPLATTPGRLPVDLALPRMRSHDGSLERRAQRIAERYLPAYVIVDGDHNVLHFSGRTGRYLDPTAGAASLDLLSLINRDLRHELRSLLVRAAESQQIVQAEGLQLDLRGSRMFVNLTVEPIQDRTGGPSAFVVVFQDTISHPEAEPDRGPSELVHSEHVDRLETELRSTRDRLQATIEELESTNEELKSSNEEYQSLNEELQSANEELETSREELQSVNEELTTVNGELAHRVHELTRATSDLKNFLESTQIATVFLDNELKVMNFTPAVTQVLHLVETDVGRPIQHIKARIPIEDLYEDVRRVLRTLGSVEREITAEDSGKRYIGRILPYRSVENYIAGAVITFVDVTAIARAEEKQRLLLAELQHRVRNTLGVVRSIVRRSAASGTSVEEYAMHIDGRLNAFARTQAIVTRDPEAGVDLEQLVVEELLAYRAQEGEQVAVSGPEVRFQPKAAETFGLAIHELATNALKHGALSKTDGRIDVRWQVMRDDGVARLTFEWSERGGPAIKTEPTHRGFGIELLERSLAFELKANTILRFLPTGIYCRIEVPLTGRVVTQPLPS